MRYLDSTNMLEQRTNAQHSIIVQAYSSANHYRAADKYSINAHPTLTYQAPDGRITLAAEQPVRTDEPAILAHGHSILHRPSKHQPQAWRALIPLGLCIFTSNSQRFRKP